MHQVPKYWVIDDVDWYNLYIPSMAIQKRLEKALKVRVPTLTAEKVQEKEIFAWESGRRIPS